MYTEDKKNTKANPTTEPKKTEGTVPMLQIINCYDDLKLTPNNNNPLWAIP